MKQVLTLVPLDQEIWWVDFKELLGVLGTVMTAVSLTIAAFTYRRNTAVRAQDVLANKIQRTHDVMVSYPGDVRNTVLTVTTQLQQGLELISEQQKLGVDEFKLNQMVVALANGTDVITLMHLLDPYGYLLSQDEYLFVETALSAFASEVERVILNPAFERAFVEILDTSSMNGITQLRQLLRSIRQAISEENKWHKNRG